MIFCRPSTTSPLKPLGQLSSNHVESSVKGRSKNCTDGHNPLIKMAAVSVWRKTTKNIFSKPMKTLSLNLEYSIGDSKSTKFVQIVILG